MSTHPTKLKTFDEAIDNIIEKTKLRIKQSIGEGTAREILSGSHNYSYGDTLVLGSQEDNTSFGTFRFNESLLNQVRRDSEELIQIIMCYVKDPKDSGLDQTDFIFDLLFLMKARYEEEFSKDIQSFCTDQMLDPIDYFTYLAIFTKKNLTLGENGFAPLIKQKGKKISLV